MAPKEKAEAQTFTFQEVACMIAAMNAGGVSLGNRHYSLMAKLDGERTASGFEHKFRAVKSRGKELATELNDETATLKATKSARKPTTSTGKKRSKKDAENAKDDGVPQTPSKKAKVKKEPSAEPSNHSADGFGLNRNHYDNAMGPQ